MAKINMPLSLRNISNTTKPIIVPIDSVLYPKTSINNNISSTKKKDHEE